MFIWNHNVPVACTLLKLVSERHWKLPILKMLLKLELSLMVMLDSTKNLMELGHSPANMVLLNVMET